MDSGTLAKGLLATIASGIGASALVASGGAAAAGAIALTHFSLDALLDRLWQTDNALAGQLNSAIDDLAGDLDSDHRDPAARRRILAGASESLARLPPKSLERWLVTPPAIEAIETHLTPLNSSERAQGARWVSAAIRRWHQHLSPDGTVVRALRDRIQAQATALKALQASAIDTAPAVHYDPARDPPSWLLRPETRATTLIGRDAALRALADWCDNGPPFAARCLAAPGGSGKTRLAIELFRQQRIDGWMAGFLRRRGDPQLLTSETVGQRLLIAVDYAETRDEELDALLPALATLQRAGTRIRLLLLTRRARAWWDSRVPGFRNHFYADWRAQAGEYRELAPPLTPDQASLQRLRAQIARCASLDDTTAAFPAAAGRSPLEWMMSAYLQLHGDLPANGEQKDLAEIIVNAHELSYLNAALKADGRYADRELAADVLAGITLAGQVTLGDAQHLPALASMDSDRRRGLLAVIQGLYGADGTGEQRDTPLTLDALRPDRLGEWFCAQQLDDAALNAFLRWTAAGLSQSAHRGKWPWLDRLANAMAVIERAAGWLGGDLAARWQRALAQLDSDALRQFITDNAVRDQRLLDFLKQCVDCQIAAAGDEPVRTAVAFANAGPVYGALGARETALDCAQRAAGHYRALAEERPEAFGPDLATSLNNLATFLSKLGRREDALKAAQEAVDILRPLAQQRPEAFGPDLATSLTNLANRLSQLGRREDALDAAQDAAGLYRPLAQQRPEAFGPDLARSLHNLANCLSKLGRREEALSAAQEAVDIRRQLAQQRPEAFGPDLAMSLTNLANRLSKLGRREDALKAAQEAVDIRRPLAQQRPEAFGPDLAMSLGTLAQVSLAAERAEAAADAAQEAAALFAGLWRQYPKAFERYVGMAIRDTAQAWQAAGREPSALVETLVADDNLRAFLQSQRGQSGPGD